MRYFKTPPEHRTKARILLVLLILTVLTGILSACFFGGVRGQAKGIPGTDAADRWTAPESPYPYAQISAYFDDTGSFSLEDVFRRRMELQKSLEQNAVSAADEDARLFLDSYSGQTTLSVTSDRDTVSVAATAVGGDFFFFHPLPLAFGDYFSENDPMPNTLILDENAAWQLFGATEVAGMEVTVAGQPFSITGVAETPDNPTEKEAYGTQPRIFINYRGLRLAGGFDTATCYEVILPNPIRNFAMDQVKQVCGISENNRSAFLYDGTTRFSMIPLLEQIPDFFRRSMRFDRIIPPYWENVARVAESKAILLAFGFAVTAVLSVIYLAAVISLWFYIHPVHIRAVYEFFEDRIEKRRMKQWLLRQQKQDTAAAASKE